MSQRDDQLHRGCDTNAVFFTRVEAACESRCEVVVVPDYSSIGDPSGSPIVGGNDSPQGVERSARLGTMTAQQAAYVPKTPRAVLDICEQAKLRGHGFHRQNVAGKFRIIEIVLSKPDVKFESALKMAGFIRSASQDLWTWTPRGVSTIDMADLASLCDDEAAGVRETALGGPWGVVFRARMTAAALLELASYCVRSAPAKGLPEFNEDVDGAFAGLHCAKIGTLVRRMFVLEIEAAASLTLEQVRQILTVLAREDLVGCVTNSGYPIDRAVIAIIGFSRWFPGIGDKLFEKPTLEGTHPGLDLVASAVGAFVRPSGRPRKGAPKVVDAFDFIAKALGICGYKCAPATLRDDYNQLRATLKTGQPNKTSRRRTRRDR